MFETVRRQHRDIGAGEIAPAVHGCGGFGKVEFAFPGGQGEDVLLFFAGSQGYRFPAVEGEIPVIVAGAHGQGNIPQLAAGGIGQREFQFRRDIPGFKEVEIPAGREGEGDRAAVEAGCRGCSRSVGRSYEK